MGQVCRYSRSPLAELVAHSGSGYCECGGEVENPVITSGDKMIGMHCAVMHYTLYVLTPNINTDNAGERSLGGGPSAAAGHVCSVQTTPSSREGDNRGPSPRADGAQLSNQHSGQRDSMRYSYHP